MKVLHFLIAAAGLLVLLPSMLLPASGNYADVRVLESNESGITFEFTPRYAAQQKIVAEGKEFQSVTFEYGSAWSPMNAGMPDVRFRSIAIGVRGVSGNRVTVLSADYETLAGFSLAPVPTIVSPTPQNPGGRVYRPSSKTTDAFSPASVAVLDNVGLVQGNFIGNLRIYPLQYNGGAKTLRKYSRIVVRVDFGPAERSSAAGGVDEGWMSTALLNYSAAKPPARSIPASPKRVLTNSVLSSGQWYKLEVRDDGMYKIDASYLRALGIDPATIGSMRDVHIYGGDGRTLPTAVQVPPPGDLAEQAVLYVDATGDSKFSSGNYILFYGQGVTGWIYSPVLRTYSHYTNPYTNSNYYFLRYLQGSGSGIQMTSVAGPASGTKVETTTGKVFFDEERTNVTESGLQWYSVPMNSNDSRVITNKLDGYKSNTAVLYNYAMLSRSDVTGTFTLEETGTSIGDPLYIGGSSIETLNDGQSNFANRDQGHAQIVPALPADNRSTLKVTYNAPSTIATGYIDWVELIYTQQLSAVNDALLFASPDMSGPVEYDLSGFSGSKFSLFDVTDVYNVQQLSPLPDQAAGTYIARDNLVAGNVKRYWAGTTAAYKTPASFIRLPGTNLRGGITGAQFIIITHRDFLSEALRLKAYKESLPSSDRLTTAVVEIDTIYNEFGNGLPDPVAVRNFLQYAYANWNPAPSYVLFFGDACYDYKNILGLDRNWVPTMETQESNTQIDTYAYDDFFAYLLPGNTSTISLAHGRLAVRSLSEAHLAVDRIIQYESSPTFGSWRNLITIVADDRDIDGTLDYAQNPEQAEQLAQNFVPKSFDVKKIYEEAYPTVIASTGRTKPGVRQAILDQVNRGTLVLNYTGHGNPKVWSHETILTKDDVGTQFFNAKTLTFIVAATCDWGRFDAVASQSSAEVAIVNPSGGAIGVVSADRAVFSDQNAVINQWLYTYLFPASQYSAVPRIGDAVLATKNGHYSGDLTNDRKYNLLCDPTLRLAVPRLVAQIDSINGRAISNAFFDTLNALSKVTVNASIRDVNGVVQNISSDSTLVTVFDSERRDSVYDSEPLVRHSFTFIEPGATIYRGENSIHAGRLSATFVIPKDISYANKQGKVAVYFSGNGTDGRGYTDRVIVGGTSTSLTNDGQGPAIQIFLDTRSFRSGDLVNENPLLLVDLADSGGINSAGASIGHRLEAWLDADSKSIDLTQFYQGAKDSYQAGTVQYQLEELAPGQHALRVRAWDVFNNSSTSQTEFSVASSTALAIQNVYNIPNPARSTTTFTFQHNQLAPVYAEIKIYTVAGRLIQVIPGDVYPDRFVKIFWDCHDRDGSRVANGTYFYKVIARTLDGKFSSESLGKLSIVR